MKHEHNGSEHTPDDTEDTDGAKSDQSNPNILGQLRDFAPSRRGFLSNTAKVGAGATALGVVGTSTVAAESDQGAAGTISGLTTKTNGPKPGTGGFEEFGDQPFTITPVPAGAKFPQMVKVACEGEERKKYRNHEIIYQVDGDVPEARREAYVFLDPETQVDTSGVYEFVGEASNCPGEEKPPFEFLQIQLKPATSGAADSPYEADNPFGYGALTDVQIVKFALLLERLESTFYTEAAGDGPIGHMGEGGSAPGGRLSEHQVERSDTAAQFANPSIRYSTFQRLQQVRDHEQTHVTALEGVLKEVGSDPNFASDVEFEFPYDTFEEFVDIAQALEDTGAGAYTAAAPAVDTEEYLAAAAQILAIEARHASYFRTLNQPLPAGSGSLNPFPDAFQPQLSVTEVVNRASPFIVGVDNVDQVKDLLG